MLGHNGAGRGSRPRVEGGVGGGCDLDDNGSGRGRFFLCVLCRQQVLICSRCDRGQIYCAGSCRVEARRMRRRETARRYQCSRSGRFKHAARSRRYRARENIVTHQGSPPGLADACLLTVSAAASEVGGAVTAGRSRVPQQGAAAGLGRHCPWCGRLCSPFLRRDYLRGRRTVRSFPPGG